MALSTYLRQQFPGVSQPTLLDLHVSLANRAHLGSYIEQAKTKHFPEGTGWEGWSSQILQVAHELFGICLGLLYFNLVWSNNLVGWAEILVETREGSVYQKSEPMGMWLQINCIVSSELPV